MADLPASLPSIELPAGQRRLPGAEPGGIASVPERLPSLEKPLTPARLPGLELGGQVIRRAPSRVLDGGPVRAWVAADIEKDAPRGAVTQLLGAARRAADVQPEKAPKDEPVVDTEEEPAFEVDQPGRVFLPEEELERELGLRR